MNSNIRVLKYTLINQKFNNKNVFSNYFQHKKQQQKNSPTKESNWNEKLNFSKTLCHYI